MHKPCRSHWRLWTTVRRRPWIRPLATHPPCLSIWWSSRQFLLPLRPIEESRDAHPTCPWARCWYTPGPPDSASPGFQPSGRGRSIMGVLEMTEDRYCSGNGSVDFRLSRQPLLHQAYRQAQPLVCPLLEVVSLIRILDGRQVLDHFLENTLGVSVA